MQKQKAFLYFISVFSVTHQKITNKEIVFELPTTGEGKIKAFIVIFAIKTDTKQKTPKNWDFPADFSFLYPIFILKLTKKIQ